MELVSCIDSFIATNSKTFTEITFFKEYLTGKVQKFKNVTLCVNTVAERMNDIPNDLRDQFRSSSNIFQAYTVQRLKAQC